MYKNLTADTEMVDLMNQWWSNNVDQNYVPIPVQTIPNNLNQTFLTY